MIKLSDHFGNYVVEIRCRKCRHARQLEPRVLAEIAGWHCELERLAPRFCCSRCHARSIALRIAFGHRPRRWNKNPS